MMDMDSEPAPKADIWTRFLLKIAAVDEDTLRLCPPQDWDNARAIGQLMLCTWVYQTFLFSMIGHRLFSLQGEWLQSVPTVAAAFLATFILLIDSYMVMRSGWHLSGIEELKRGGTDISGGIIHRVKAACFLVIRIVLSVGLAQLTAVFFSLLFFWADVEASIQARYARDNARQISEASVLVDDDIRRAADAVKVESTRASALSAQAVALRQNQIDPSANDPAVQQAQQEATQLLAQKAKDEEEVRKAETFATNELGGIKSSADNSGHAGNGPRHRAAVAAVGNARAHLQQTVRDLATAQDRLTSLRNRLAAASDGIKEKSRDQTPEFEQALADENKRLATLKEQLASLTQGRYKAIRDAVENAPGYVRRDDGLLAQLRTLDEIAQENPKIGWVVVLIDVVSFGFELASVLAKVTSYVPTTYAALLARDAYLTAVEIVDGMMAVLDDSAARQQAGQDSLPPQRRRPGKPSRRTARPSPDKAAGRTAGLDPFADLGELRPQPPKRPRGRPRKSPAPATAANGQEQPA